MNKRYQSAKVKEIELEEFTKGMPKELVFSHFEYLKYNKGAHSALKELYKKYPLFIASNHIKGYFEKELEILGAKKYFKDIFVSYKLKTAKPSKEFFEILIKKSGFNANESIFVDDTKRNLQIAKSIGMITVWFNHKRMDAKRNELNYLPDYEITDLRELSKIISKLNTNKSKN
ncbi:MAG: HAD family hydrolase [archaeon]